MQNEFDGLKATQRIQILGVNQVGHESANDLVCDGRNLPWLQEALPSDMAWVPWNVTWRDVVILNRENQKVAVFNLTERPLSTAANYDSLRTLLLEIAE